MNETIIKNCGFGKHVDMINNKMCPFCQKVINMNNFRNEISKKEYKISGLCQECQDKIFGKD
ncbi:MAG: hypothetical protein ACOYEJ_09035 [Mahellales bacterium]